MFKRVPKSPAYLWYPDNVLASSRVDDLSPADECWYRRALDRSWMDEGVPADPVKFAKRISKIGHKCPTKTAAMILNEFFVPKKKDPTKMVNERQEKERKKYEENFRKKSNAGKVSGRKRREKKELSAEQRSNGVRTVNEHLIPILNPILKEEEREETPLLEIHLGNILAGVKKELGVKKLTASAEREWINHGKVAFENSFSDSQFVKCFSMLRQKHDYPILPQYVTDRLPDFAKTKKPSEHLPTLEEKLADDAANRAAMRPPPKPVNVETVQ